MFGRQTGWKATGGGGGGGESLAQTLVIGNATGGNNILVTGGDYIRFGNGTNANYVGITGGVTTASYDLTLPTEQGAASSFLMNDGSGVLSWSTVAPGDENLEETLAIGNYTGAYDILISATKAIKWDNADETRTGTLQTANITVNRTWILPDKAGTLTILSGLTTGVIPKASSATDLTDGSWEFNANTLRPTTTGSDLGDSTHRISTIYMSSTINYGAGSNLLFTENGSDRMFIQTSTGWVGIGTTSPLSLLHLEETNNTFNHTLRLKNNSGGNSAATDFFASNDTGSNVSFGVLGSGNTSFPAYGAAGDGFLRFNAGDVNFSNINASSKFKYYIDASGASGSAVVTMTSNSIGINGVTSPTSNLHVKTSLGGSGLRVEPNGSTTPVLYTNDSGFVSIGTTSPIGILSVSYANNSQYHFSIQNRAYSTAGSDAFKIYQDNSGWTAFGNTSGDAAMSFLVNGNLGVGTLAGTASARVHARGKTAATAVNPFLASTETYSDILVAHSNGNVGINTSSPTSNLHVKTSLGGSGFYIESNGGSSILYTNDSRFVGVSATAATANNERFAVGGVSVFKDTMFVGGSGDDGFISYSPGAHLGISALGNRNLRLETSSGSGSIIFKTNGSDRGALDSNGYWSFTNRVTTGGNTLTKSTFNNEGSVSENKITDTAINYTVLSTDYIVRCTATLTITLPAISATDIGVGKVFRFKAVGAVTITINPNAADTIDGSGTGITIGAYGYVTLRATAALTWEIMD